MPFTGLSDHCCISVNIKTRQKFVDNDLTTDKDNETTIHTQKFKYAFDKDKTHLYEQNLSNDENINRLRISLSQDEVSVEDINKSVGDLNDILTAAAQKTFPIKKIFARKEKNKNKPKTKGWFTKECATSRKIFRKYSKLISEKPFDRQIFHSFIKARAAYKRTCRNAEKCFRHTLTKKLIEVGQRDPKTFWSIIDKMNNWGKDKIDHSDNISPKKWKKYFEELLNEKGFLTPQSTHTKETNTFDPLLDGAIKEEELRDAMKELKSGKTPGLDGIYGECLKIFWAKYESILLRLLRRIFANYIYPTQWTTHFLKPIYKKGGAFDPDNFRGLAIGSALAKVFSIIMLKRLNNFIEIKKLISPNQVGFMKGSCTSDHIFLLQTIIEKIVKKGKKRLYAAFIDFKKAYDKVNRKSLLETLKKLGINGIFLRNIESMYKHISYSIKLKNGHLDPISSNLGLKQGCPLSPMLFNLYIDDIKYIFADQCDPIPLSDTYINHFLYADDLVLLSQSRTGLQKCLDQVHKFSLGKHLTISIEKSKTLVFNYTGRLIKQSFTVGGTSLEPVQSFCYLGFEVKASGTVKHAIKTLYDKANKAMKPLFNAIARFNIPVKTAIRLFHTYISPIALYNAENFLQLTEKQLETVTEETLMNDNCEINIIHKKFLKYLLGVCKSTPNLSVMGDTGEIPLLFKGFRLMMNYWHRIHKLPNETLAKKALTENVNIRTTWIRTIEKLLNLFQITYTENIVMFKAATKKSVDLKYLKTWEHNLFHTDQSRLEFYKTVKSTFGYEDYLEIRNFECRKGTAKIRCSSHTLEIEKGRHSNKPRNERICPVCNLNEVETEEHFLTKCPTYQLLRNNYNLTEYINGKDLFTYTSPNLLGQFIVDASKFRKAAVDLLGVARGQL